MISINTVRVLDYCVIGVAGSSCLLSIAGAAYIAPWTPSRRKLHAAREFTLYWKARFLLQLLGAAWAASQLLRLAAAWHPASSLADWRVSRALCRVYLCLSLGVLEPLFLLCTLLLCRGGLRVKPREGLWPNAWVLALACAAALPVVICQAVIAWLGVFFPQERCSLCMFPAASCIAAVAFAGIWGVALFHVTNRMVGAVMNHRLKRRLRFFQLALLTLLALGGALRVATLSSTPFTWLFQALWLAHFLTIPCLLAVTLTMLVILPMHDAYAAEKPLPRIDEPRFDEEKPP